VNESVLSPRFKNRAARSRDRDHDPDPETIAAMDLAAMIGAVNEAGVV
jgi:hypothetical protein